MKAALGASLKAEEEAVKTRFEKAEKIWGEHSEEVSKKQQSEKPERVVRDSFTLPSDDYALIQALKQRCLGCGVNITKSEAIRAGLHALKKLSDEEVLEVVEGLTKVKTGRPKQRKSMR